jgi:DNA-binding transcriptional MerR regulator
MASQPLAWLEKTKRLLESAPAEENPGLQLNAIRAEGNPVNKLKACERFLKTFAKDVAGYDEVLRTYMDPAARAERIRDIGDAKLRRVYCEAFFKDFPQPGKAHSLVQELYDANDELRLKQIKSAKDPKQQLALCEAFFERYPERSKIRAEVEDIHAMAQTALSKALAEQEYALEMRGKAAAHNMTYLRQSEVVVKDAKDLKPVPKEELADPQKPLNEGELLAIRAYTADNYRDINPNVQNNREWADATGKPVPAKFEDDASFQAALAEYESKGRQGRREEGVVHAGVLMEACKKLKPKKGTIYRGQRMTEARFASEFREGNVLPNTTFSSSTLRESVARGFAAGSSRHPREETVSVVCEIEVTNARDVQSGSVQGKNEGEWLVLPGTLFKIVKIKDDKQREVGNPPATKWKFVKMKEIQP